MNTWMVLNYEKGLSKDKQKYFQCVIMMAMMGVDISFECIS